MKKLVRTIALLATLACLGATGSSALPGYQPGDCAYECYNPTTDMTIQGQTQASPYACCWGQGLTCPAGYTYAGTYFYVDSYGPEVCSEP